MSSRVERNITLKALKLGQNEKGAVLLVSVVTLSLLTLAGLSTVEQTLVQERVAMNGRAAGGASLNSEKGLKQAVADLVAGDIFENCTGDAENDPDNWRCEKSGDGYTYVVTYVMDKSGNVPATDENGDTIYKVSVAGVEAGASGGSFAADQLTAGVVLHDTDSSADPDYESLSEQCQSTYNPVTRKVTFCHETGNGGHNLLTTNINGWLNGHRNQHNDFCALDCSNGDPGAPVVSEGEVPSYTLMFYTRGDVEFYAGGVESCEETGNPASSKSDSSKSDKSSKSDSSKSDKSSKSDSSTSDSGGSSASVNCVALESSSSESSKSESSDSKSKGKGKGK